MKKAYIAGKITGLENYKETFKKGEEKLKSLEFAVMNPSILPENFEQMDYLHVCMAMIDVCDTVFFLPTWTDSKGAHLEMGYSRALKKDIKFL